MVNIGVGFELSASTIDIGGARLGSHLLSLSRGVASICFILPSHLSPSWITSEKPPFPLYQSHSLAGLIYYNIPDLWAQWWVRGWGRRVSRPSRMCWDVCTGRLGCSSPLSKGVHVRFGGATVSGFHVELHDRPGSEGTELRRILVASWEAGIKLCPKPGTYTCGFFF